MSLPAALNTFLGPTLIISMILIECLIKFSSDIYIKKIFCSVLIISMIFLAVDFFISLFNIIPPEFAITDNFLRTGIFFIPLISVLVIFFLCIEKTHAYFQLLIILFIGIMMITLFVNIMAGSNKILWPFHAALLLFTYFFLILNDTKIDILTGLNNRFSFFEFTGRISRNKAGESWIMAMLDVNNFKSINNIYGHPEGDDVLRSLARIIKKCSRKTDFTARYGGDEFIIVTRAENGIDPVISYIIDELDNQNEKSDKPYNIEVNYGAEIFIADGNREIDDFLNHLEQLMKKQNDDSRRIEDFNK